MLNCYYKSENFTLLSNLTVTARVCKGEKEKEKEKSLAKVKFNLSWVK